MITLWFSVSMSKTVFVILSLFSTATFAFRFVEPCGRSDNCIYSVNDIERSSDPNNCSNYFQCNSISTWSNYSCQSDNPYFDIVSLECEKSNANCQEPCPTTDSPTLPHTTNPTADIFDPTTIDETIYPTTVGHTTTSNDDSTTTTTTTTTSRQNTATNGTVIPETEYPFTTESSGANNNSVSIGANIFLVVLVTVVLIEIIFALIAMGAAIHKNCVGSRRVRPKGGGSTNSHHDNDGGENAPTDGVVQGEVYEQIEPLGPNNRPDEPPETPTNQTTSVMSTLHEGPADLPPEVGLANAPGPQRRVMAATSTSSVDVSPAANPANTSQQQRHATKLQSYFRRQLEPYQVPNQHPTRDQALIIANECKRKYARMLKEYWNEKQKEIAKSYKNKLREVDQQWMQQKQSFESEMTSIDCNDHDSVRLLATEHVDELKSSWTRQLQLLDDQEDDLRRRLDVSDLTDEQRRSLDVNGNKRRDSAERHDQEMNELNETFMDEVINATSSDTLLSVVKKYSIDVDKVNSHYRKASKKRVEELRSTVENQQNQQIKSMWSQACEQLDRIYDYPIAGQNPQQIHEMLNKHLKALENEASKLKDCSGDVTTSGAATTTVH